jgi:16S rRNA (uracil1498-N3)-methyltransferase
LNEGYIIPQGGSVARRRFFVDEIRHGRAVLAGEDARHLRQVLRAETGQRYEICDNRSVYIAEIETVRKDEVSFQVLEELPAEPPPLVLTLLLALTKFDRFEWALEKATELGVAAVVPVKAERSEKGLERAAAKRVERWRKIVRETSQQARRARMPEVFDPVSFDHALAAPGPNRYFLDETGGDPLLSVVPAHRTRSDEVRLAIGPEGGWTDAERGLARKLGWMPVSLGPMILRAETAATAATAIIVNAWLTAPMRL